MYCVCEHNCRPSDAHWINIGCSTPVCGSTGDCETLTRYEDVSSKTGVRALLLEYTTSVAYVNCDATSHALTEPKTAGESTVYMLPSSIESLSGTSELEVLESNSAGTKVGVPERTAQSERPSVKNCSVPERPSP